MNARIAPHAFTLATFVLACAFFALPARAASSWDQDGDGYDDATEMANGYTPYGPGRLDEHDADADGLKDGEELTYGTNPLKADSDADGYADGVEMAGGYDPRIPGGEKLKKSIRVDISEQKLSYFAGDMRIGTFPVSTGRPGSPTPRGTFAINDKMKRAWSRRASLWMPWWMPFIGTTYGLHELPEWPGGKKEGENHLGTPVSGGCIRLGVGAAKTLYDWAEVGTEVAIAD